MRRWWEGLPPGPWSSDLGLVVGNCDELRNLICPELSAEARRSRRYEAQKEALQRYTRCGRKGGLGNHGRGLIGLWDRREGGNCRQTTGEL